MPALLEIWLYARSRNPMFMPSTMGRSPVIAAPMPIPMNPFSAHSEPSVNAKQYIAVALDMFAVFVACVATEESSHCLL